MPQQDVLASQVSSQLIRNRQRSCRAVYECALNQAVLPSTCTENNGSAIGETAEGVFFGRAPQQYKVVFPQSQYLFARFPVKYIYNYKAFGSLVFRRE
jgi:hypothetical protein